MDNPFLQIGIVFMFATILGMVARLFKQPLILAYIFTGLSLGFLGTTNKVVGGEILPLLSQFGISFLLFMVGMELKITDLKQVGKVVLITGLGQVSLTFIAGFLISLALGFSSLTSIYLSLALTFSSTIIIVKLLSEKGDLDSLSGKLSVGLLLVQDLVAISILMLLSGFKDQLSPQFLSLLIIFGKGLALLLIVSLLTKKLVPYIFQICARNQELLLLLAVSWCFLVASISLFLGFSLEIGAFLAGISLSSLPYHYQISSRIKPLRDLFATLFFVGLGMQMTSFPNLNLLLPIIVLVAFVLIVKPLIVLLIMGILGFRKRTSFLTSTSLGQISEFSLILVTVGKGLQHVSPSEVSLVTAVGITTIAISSYLILSGQQLYSKLGRILSVFEKEKTHEQRFKTDKPLEDHIVLVGCNRMGSDILEFLQKRKEPYLVLDFNPEVIRWLESQNVPCIFGDVSDEEILEQLNLKSAKIVISTVASLDDNLALISAAKVKNSSLVLLVTAVFPEDVDELYRAGADYVILPHLLGGKHVAHILSEHTSDLEKYLFSKRKKSVLG